LVYDFLHGVTKGLMPTDYQTWLNIFEGAPELYRQMGLPQIQQRVDGLIVGGSTQTSWLPPQLTRMVKAGIPLVTFFEEAYPGVINICVDYYQQGRLPTEHLLACNCRKIVNLTVLESRHRGYVDALRKAGLSVKEERIVKCKDFGLEGGKAAVRRLLKAKIPFDGIVAQSDHQALGAIQELLANGIPIPDKVRVTGVDDGPISLASPVPLTTVTAEAYNMGLLVVEAMLKMLSQKPVQSVALMPRMVIRRSA
jgi:LacI family transcriptional regulator